MGGAVLPSANLGDALSLPAVYCGIDRHPHTPQGTGSLLPWCVAKPGWSSVQRTLIFMGVLIKLPLFRERQNFLFQNHELQKHTILSMAT